MVMFKEEKKKHSEDSQWPLMQDAYLFYAVIVQAVKRGELHCCAFQKDGPAGRQTGLALGINMKKGDGFSFRPVATVILTNNDLHDNCEPFPNLEFSDWMNELAFNETRSIEELFDVNSVDDFIAEKVDEYKE
jgi:hypothetical protein